MKKAVEGLTLSCAFSLFPFLRRVITMLQDIIVVLDLINTCKFTLETLKPDKARHVTGGIVPKSRCA